MSKCLKLHNTLKLIIATIYIYKTFLNSTFIFNNFNNLIITKLSFQ